MPSFDRFFYLYLLSQFNGERSLSGLLHLLKGKKSSQTIQDRLFYKAEPFFACLPWISLNHIKKQIQTLSEDGYVSETEPEHYILTEKGNRELDLLRQKKLINPSFFYVQFIMDDSAYWNRLKLLVQVTSHLAHNDSRYLPIITDTAVQMDIKKLLKELSLTKQILSSSLQNELEKCLNEMPDSQADFIVMQFSGKGIWGKTLTQTGQYFDLTREQMSVSLKSAIRSILTIVTEDSGAYPLLYKLFSRSKQGNLTQSAAKTYHFVKKGYQIEGISRIRQLKYNTIEDHIVEIALNDKTFTITSYVNEADRKQIAKAFNDANTNKLKEIKKRVGDNISYFQIRLVLAKESEPNG